MPVEPPASTWTFPPAGTADAWGLAGVGADLEPGTLLAAYRAGLFPMPLGPDRPIAWWSPDPRGVLEPGAFHVSRSLARSRRRFALRIDTTFADVVDGCADPARPHGWIDGRIRAAYVALHELGWAHSVEAWTADGELAGGLYGVAIGGLFAAESKFTRVGDASKAALAGLADLLVETPGGLIDIQWLTPHLARLGGTELPRPAYLDRLARALAASLPPAFGR